MKFICFDGETLGKEYFLLGNNSNYIINRGKKGLSSKECLSFLWDECSSSENSKHIIFRIDFDINFWVKDFPHKDKVKLFNAVPVEWKGYKLLYYKNKFLELRNGWKSYIIYDIYSFFNTSFLKVIELLKIPLTKYEEHILDLGKEKRMYNFDGMSDYDIKQYNQTECIIASKIGGVLYTLTKKCFYEGSDGRKRDFYVRNFYGASAIAQKFLNSFDFGSNSFVTMFAGQEIRHNIKSAYFGGRMEALQIGSFRNLWKYDINSAYPSVIQELREIEKISMDKDTEDIIDTDLYFCDLEIYDLELPGLLPHRHKTGMLFFPSKVKGWFYGCEIKQVKKYEERYFLNCKILKRIHFSLGEKIFGNQIKEIYNQRLILKQKKDVQQYILKILLNSVYGKFAQRVGKHQHQNFYYAGYITAKTRAKLLAAVIEKDAVYDTIFFATDGILTTKKLNLPITSQMGDWEEIKIAKAEVILSGVYKLIGKDKKIYKGERGYRFDFNKVFSDIKKQGFSDIETTLFIGFKYGNKNHIKYGKDILRFIKLNKKVTPKSNVKRYFSGFNLNKKNKSLLINLSELKKLKQIGFIFDEKDGLFDR